MISKLQIKKLAKELYQWSATHTAGEVKRAALDVVRVFYKKGTVRPLKELVAMLEQMDEKARNTSRIEITTAFPLSAALQEKIAKMVHPGESVVTQKIKPELIGGAEIRFNDKLINMSLKHQLNNLVIKN